MRVSCSQTARTSVCRSWQVKSALIVRCTLNVRLFEFVFPPGLKCPLKITEISGVQKNVGTKHLASMDSPYSCCRSLNTGHDFPRPETQEKEEPGKSSRWDSGALACAVRHLEARSVLGSGRQRD